MHQSLARLKTWVGSSYTVSSAYHRWRLDRETRKPGAPVIVYQMGKVASTTIVESIHACSPDTPVYHVHFLTEEGISAARERLLRLGNRFNANFWCLYESAYVRRNVMGPARRLKIVTLLREPVGRTISSFFYNLNQYIPDFNRYRIDDPEVTQRLQERFLVDFPEHDYSINWFDNELRRTFGIDVYRHGFDPGKGYAIIEGASVDVLVLKLERLKHCTPEAFREFLGLSEFALSTANTSEEQPYYQFYKKFLEEVRLPASYLDKMYTSPYMRHFYSADEIATFRTMWNRD